MRAIKSLAYISEDYNPLDFGGIWLCEDYTVPLHSAAFAFLWMRSVRPTGAWNAPQMTPAIPPEHYFLSPPPEFVLFV